MRPPVKGEQLRSSSGEVWIVVRVHPPRGSVEHFSVDLIRQQDLTQTSRSLNLTGPEFEYFCQREGINYSD